MRRSTETQMHFPLLNVIYDPLANNTVLVTMQMDWGQTGDVDIRYTSLQSLIDAARVLDFARNAVADEILAGKKRLAKNGNGKEKDQPF